MDGWLPHWRTSGLLASSRFESPNGHPLIFPRDVLRNSAERVSRNHSSNIRTASPKCFAANGSPALAKQGALRECIPAVAHEFCEEPARFRPVRHSQMSGTLRVTLNHRPRCPKVAERTERHDMAQISGADARWELKARCRRPTKFFESFALRGKVQRCAREIGGHLERVAARLKAQTKVSAQVQQALACRRHDVHTRPHDDKRRVARPGDTRPHRHSDSLVEK